METPTKTISGRVWKWRIQSDRSWSPFCIVKVMVNIWLVVWECHFLFSHSYWVDVIIPIDELSSFSEGWVSPTTNQIWWSSSGCNGMNYTICRQIHLIIGIVGSNPSLSLGPPWYRRTGPHVRPVLVAGWLRYYSCCTKTHVCRWSFYNWLNNCVF